MPVERYPGLRYMAEGWDSSPWTRVSFGLQWVVEPGGRYPLTISIKHPKKYFGSSLEQALRRFIRIRGHERGSSAEGEAIAAVQADLRAEHEARRGNDPVERTAEILNDAKGDLSQRFPGVFDFPDPQVRRRAAELLGEYAQREGGEGFLPGRRWSFFGEALARRLEDESPEVRRAAASALHRIGGLEPVGSDDELVTRAGRLWAEAATEAGAAAEDS